MLAMMVAATVQAAGWQVTDAKDPITDKTEVRAALHGDTADLVFSCVRGEEPTLIYAPDEFLGGGFRPYGEQYALRNFTYRFDSQPALKEWWKYHDHNALPFTSENAAKFVTKMIQSKKLVVRAARYDGRTIDSSFDLAGAPQAFHQAFEACGIR
jgi:hypothetical protein